MPKVPTYDSFQTTPTAPAANEYKAFELADVAGSQARATGQALINAGSGLARVATDMQNDANAVRIDDAMNQIIKTRTDLLVDAQQQKGRNALERPDGKSLPDEYGEKLSEAVKSIETGLGNDAQRFAFKRQAGQLSNQFRASLSSHMLAEQNAYAKETDQATIETAVNQGSLLWGDPNMRAQSTTAITATVSKMAAREGWDDTVKQAKLNEALSPMHIGVMQGMITAGMASKAVEYYEQNSAGMTLQARARMQSVVKEAGNAQEAENATDSVWGALGPKDINDPVRLFDLEQKLREDLKSNPDALSKAIASVRTRAQAFNSQQSEFNSSNTNKVFGLIDQGVGMSAISKTSEWLALPEVKRHEIKKALEAESMAREQKAMVSDARRERQMLIRNADAYMAYSDPLALASMTRAQVQALRPTFGLDGTQQLLTKWESIQTREGKLEATIDKDLFSAVADEMGLNPFDKKKQTKEQKEALGLMQYRVESLIDLAQKNKKSPLTRQEKEDLMRSEVAKTVTVDYGMFSFEKDVPVIGMTPKDFDSLVVPKAERESIVSALKQMSGQAPGNALYEPTEANVRRLYLMKQSKAGGLVNGK